MKNVFKAISAFQKEVPIIHKATQGYNYTYADLSSILTKINPLLEKHGLGFTQLGTGASIKTIIFHCDSGEFVESVFDIPQGVKLGTMNDFQVMGSAITYIRRYALSSALGLVTDKDTDAASTTEVKKVSTPPATPPPAKMTRKQGMELIAKKITADIDEQSKNEIAYELTDTKHQAQRQSIIDKLNAGAKPADVLAYLTK